MPAHGTGGQPYLAWIYLISADLLEIVWAFAMEQSEGFTRLTSTLVMVAGVLGSFWFQAPAS